VQWQGDSKVQFSYALKTNKGLSDYISTPTLAVDSGLNEDNFWRARINRECRYLYGRFQLTAHPADGDFTVTDPPNVPMPTYGVINLVSPNFGASRNQAP
jgi:hypothetical protein